MVNVTKLCLLATAWAGAVLASNTVTDGVRTIAGELVTVAVESDLDVDGQTAGKVVLTEGGRAGCGAGRRLRGRGRMDVHGRAAGGGRHGVRAEGARAGDAGSGTEPAADLCARIPVFRASGDSGGGASGSGREGCPAGTRRPRTRGSGGEARSLLEGHPYM